ncbi:uncharacterized protein LOC122756795 [Drosophila mojavensis]|uniref:uncharacterized protein LOC122756795 n=1 Tax=Drosophila mojavensis TaxID=7230 RepID=UPI001CD0F59F|nr:uncharacterized protein LOC122756795 [Drosophila mojavensis]
MRSTLFAVSLLQFSFMLQFSNAGQCKFTNAVCKSHNESWVTVDMCRLRAINRNKTTLNLQVTLLHTTKTVHAESQIFFKANGYKPWLYKPSIDICRFLKKPYNPVAVLVFNLLKNYTNFNTRCPLLPKKTCSWGSQGLRQQLLLKLKQTKPQQRLPFGKI